MFRFTTLRLLALSVVASLSLLMLPGGALASPPFVDTIDFAIPDDVVCGVSTSTYVSGTQTFHIQQMVVDQGSGNIWFEGIIKVKATVTFTSNENGHVLTNTLNFSGNDISYEQLSESVFAFTYAQNGIPVWLRDGNKTLVKDSGRIVFTDTWDLHDLNNPDDDEFLGSDLVGISGPHPAFDSSAFCDAYVPLMTA